MKITENFTLKELCKSNKATILGIKEQFEPPSNIIVNLKYHAENLLEPIRDEVGAFTPNNTYRCPRLNDAVGGSKSSLHLIACASDIDLIDVEKNIKLFEFIKNNLNFTELINEYGYDWVHVGIIKGRETEKQIKRIYNKQGYKYVEILEKNLTWRQLSKTKI